MDQSRTHTCISIFVSNFPGNVLTFYDVNFAAIWPWTGFTERPKGGPGTTPRRHVLDIEHDYRFAVRLLGRDADAVTSARGGRNNGRIVRTHEERPVLH